MTPAAWLAHFTGNRLRPLPQVGDCPEVPAAWRASLARSLAVFQLGESNGGRLSAEIDAMPGLDPDYRAAIKLFIAEEQRHGQVLAACVLGLGGKLRQEAWSESAFRRLRRLLGVRLKLATLVAAETVGLAFYRLLAARLPPGGTRAALVELCNDEVIHLRFHADSLGGPEGLAGGGRRPQAGALLTAGRLPFRAAVLAIAGAGALAIAVDHRHTLRTVGLSWREIAHGFTGEIHTVAEALAAPPARAAEPQRFARAAG